MSSPTAALPAAAADSRPEPGLELRGIRKAFGARTVLAGVDLTVPGGRIVGFVGGNGAGKTTTMRVALGLVAPDAGTVRVGGRAARAELGAVGYLPEERGLYPRMRVAEHLEYLCRLRGLGAAPARRRVRYWLERLAVAERAGDPVERLSLGSQQRVQLAAALVAEPEALVLDEPFSGLDPLAVEMMAGVLRECRTAGMPILFSSHQLDLVERLCDHLAVLHGGVIAVSGQVEALRRSGPLRLAVASRHLPGDWLAGCAPAAELSRTAETVVVECPDVAAAAPAAERERRGDQVLRAALAYGPVTAFGPVVPSIADLYAELVRR